jgi:hypothetical protein
MDEFDTMVNNNDLGWTLIQMSPLKYSTWMELCIWIKFDKFDEIWLHGWNLKLSWILKLITLIHHALCFHLPMLKPCWMLPISSIAFGLLTSFKCYCISSLLYLLLHVDNFIHVINLIMWFSFSSMPNLLHTINCTCVVDFIREHSKSNH